MDPTQTPAACDWNMTINAALNVANIALSAWNAQRIAKIRGQQKAGGTRRRRNASDSLAR